MDPRPWRKLGRDRSTSVDSDRRARGARPFGFALWLLLALLPFSPAIAPLGAAETLDVSSLRNIDAQAQLSLSQFRLNRTTGNYLASARITNVSNETIAVPIYLVVTSITPPSSTVIGAHGQTVDGKPYFDLSALLPGGALAAAGSSAPLPLQVRTPDNAAVQLSINVYARVPNRAPQADAGASATATVGTLVRLDGSHSSDPDGDPLNYRWTLRSRPAGSAALLSDQRAINPTFTLDVPGDYLGELVVNDGHLDSLPATVTISTVNSPPHANAGPDQTAAVGATIVLDGSGSSNADGDLLSYLWSLVSRPPGSQAQVSPSTGVQSRIVIDRRGEYVARLEVTDPSQTKSADDTVISTRNSAPVAHIARTGGAQVGETVTLDGTASTDVDGDLLSYHWSLLGRPPGSAAALSGPGEAQPTLLLDIAGEYTVQLLVNDGVVDSAAATLALSTTNARPVADAGPDQTQAVGAHVILDGHGSHDADGDPLTFTWSLTTVPLGSQAHLNDEHAERPSFDLDIGGTYTAQLVVNDGHQDSAADTVVITTENSRPRADAGSSQSVVIGSAVNLDGSRSSDVDGDVLRYQWSLLNKPENSAAQLSGADTVAPSFVLDKAGVYVVQLIVRDAVLASEPATVTITNKNQAPFITSAPETTVEALQVYHYDAEAVDPDSDVLTYRLGNHPAAMSIDAQSGLVSWTPTEEDVGAHTVVVQARDPGGEQAEQQFVVTVLPINHAPSIRSAPPLAATVGAQYRYLVEASDPDAGDELHFTLVGAPAGMSIEPISGLLTWTPDATQSGIQQVQVRASDRRDLSVVQAFSVTVSAPNRPPSITSAPVTEVQAGSQYGYRVVGTDPDAGDTLRYSLVTSPVGMTIDATSGAINWLPSNAQAGPQNVTIRVTDLSGFFAAQTFVINVSQANRPPTIVSTPDVSRWIQLAPTGRPPSPRAYYSETSSYDAFHDRLILFGGSENDVGPRYLNEVWVLTKASGMTGTPEWIKLAPTGGPPPARVYHLVVYDPTANRLIVTAGAGGNALPLFGDTWVLTNANGLGGTPEWIELPSTEVLAGSAGGYDAVSNRLVRFGGFTTAGDTNAVKVLKDANGIGNPEWVTLAPQGAPPPPRGEISSATYDPLSNKLIVFGGGHTNIGGSRVFNDVWVLSNANGLGGTPEWNQLAPAGPLPTARHGHAANYDPNSNRLLVFGGAVVPSVFINDSWILTNANGAGGTPEWKQLTPRNASLIGRYGSASGYNTAANRLIVTMGRNDDLPSPHFLNDVWILINASGNCTVGQVCSYQLKAEDLDPGDTLTYALELKPQGMTISPEGLITWTPTAADIGKHSITARVTDSAGSLVTQSFDIAISSVAVPNVVGLAPQWAEQMLAAAGLSAGDKAHTGGDVNLRFDVLPSDQGWNYEAVGNSATETDVFSVSSDVLTQNSLSVGFQGQGGNVYKISNIVDRRLPFKSATRARVLNEVSQLGRPYGFCMEVLTGFDFGDVGLGVDQIADAFLAKIAFDNTQYHDYVLDADAGHSYTLTIDGELRQTSKPRTLVEPSGVLFGDCTGGTNAHAELTAFRFEQQKVTDQVPQAGTLVSGQTAVDLTIQDGPATQFVPNVVGQSQPAAQAAILGAQLKQGAVTLKPSDSIPTGQIISQRPIASVHVPKDTIVTYILSTGPPNRAPAITSASNPAASVGQIYQYDVQANDPDAGDVLRFTLGTHPSGMSIDATTGRIVWTPDAGQVGQQQVTVTVLDQGDLSDTQNYAITVAPANHSPVIVSIPLSGAVVGQLYAYDVNANDPDAGDVLTYTLSASPAGMSIDSATGLIHWTPSVGQQGAQHAVATVTDGGGLFAVQVLDIVVTTNIGNHGPIILSAPSVSRWMQIQPTGTAPGPRGNAGVSAYDEFNDRLILFSGEDGSGVHPHPADVWVLIHATERDGAARWERLAPTNAGPGGRVLHTVVYDPTANRLIVHGGCGGHCAPDFGDTWALTNANGLGGDPQWIPLPSTVQRHDHSAHFNIVANRMIVFGGHFSGADSNDVDVLVDANGIGAPRWVKLETTGDKPPPRGHEAVSSYDELTDRLIIFGGSTQSGTYFNDTWVLTNASGQASPSQWVQLAPAGSPPPVRGFHRTVHDANTNRLIAHGGFVIAPGQNPVYYTDTWALSNANGLGGAPQWSQLPTGGTMPLVSDSYSLAYGRSQNRLMVGLGSDATGYKNDVWLLLNASGDCTVGQPCTYQLQVEDSDAGDVLTYALDNAPSAMTVSNTGLINWTPTAADIGTHAVTARVTDPVGLFATQSFDITVASVAVPNVVGLAPEWAEQIIAAAGLSAGSSTHTGGDITLRFDFLPSAQGWTYLAFNNDYPEQSAFKIAAGTLKQDTLAAGFQGQGSNEYNFDGVTDRRLPFEIALRSRTLEEVGDIQRNSFGFRFGSFTGTETFGFGLGTGQIQDQRITRIPFDNTQFHHYKLQALPGIGYRLSIDNSLVASGPTVPTVFRNQIVFGDGTGGTNARAEITAYSFKQARVTNQNPLAGSVVTNSATVDLTIQDGPATQTVPDLTGQTQAQAEAAILGAQLKVGTVTQADSETVPAGHMISQKTLAGIRVPKDTLVSFILSTGPPNRPPTITSSAITTSTVGVAYTYDANATDPDLGDVLSFSLGAHPNGMGINASTGLISWTPSADQTGQQQVTVTVLDQGGLSASQSYFVTVAPANHPPVIISIPVLGAVVGQLYAYDVDASDPDAGDVLTYTLTPPPAGMTIDSVSGLIHWTPSIDQTGAQHAVVTVTDGGGLFAVQELAIVVTTNIGNRLPVITSTPVLTHEISVCPLPPDQAWVTPAPLLTPRYYPGVAVSGNQIYAIGGCNSGVCGDTQTAFVESYDPATELWTPRAPMSIARGWLAANEINGLIYAVGGRPGGSATNALEVYDPLTDAWSLKAPMSTTRFAPVAGTINGQLFVAGGHSDTGAGSRLVYLSSLEMYQPQTNQWTTKAPMHTARVYAAGGVIAGKLYVVGGSDAVGTILNSLEVYDPVTDSWTNKTSMPTARVAARAAVLDGKLYVSGGSNSTTPGPLRLFNEVEVYDPVTDSWATAPPLLTPRAGPGAAVLNGRLHVMGGASQTAPLTVHEVFTPPASPYAYDLHAEDPDGDSLLYGLLQFPQGMSIDPATGAVRWSPQINQAGEHDVLVRVDDNHGGKDEQSYKLNVVVQGHRPVITSTPAIATNVGEPYRYSVEASDTDTCETLSYALTAAPLGMEINAVTGLITWTPTAEQAGQRNVVVRVTDSGGVFTEQVYVINVTVGNHAPVITSAPTQSQWTQLHPSGTPPSARALVASGNSYDPINDRLILFGGSEGIGNASLNETWVLANATGAKGTEPPVWIKLATTGSPPVGRIEHSVEYDLTANRLIVHGGCGGTCAPDLGDVWVLTNANGLGGAPEWIALPATQAREGHVSGYDPVGNRMVVFGGHGPGFAGRNTNDVSVLIDANGIGTPAWIGLSPVGDPPPPRGEVASGAYDPISNRLIIFGGKTTRDFPFNDTWVLSNANGLGGTPTWIQLSPSGTLPTPRGGHSVVYDANSNRIIVHGGVTPTNGVWNFKEETWALTHANGLGGDPQWIRIEAEGALPPVRTFHTVGYSSATNRMVATSGLHDDKLSISLNDAWVLTNASGNCTVGQACNYQLKANDPDAADTLTYAFDVKPAGMTITADGLVAWTPTAADIGTHAVTARVTDAAGLFVTQSFDITVAAVAVPNVVGLAPEWAEQIFVAAGLTPGASTHAGGAVSLRFDALPSEQGWAFDNQGTAVAETAFSVAGGVLRQDTASASGDVFAMYKLTAVDQRLPFQMRSRVRVTEGGLVGVGLYAETDTEIYSFHLNPRAVLINDTSWIVVSEQDNTTFHDYLLERTPTNGHALGIDGVARVQNRRPLQTQRSPDSQRLLIGDPTNTGGNARAEYTLFNFTQPRVITQSLPPGTLVPKNSNVDITIQDGPATQTVPDLSGQTQAQAEAAILGAQLKVGDVTQADSETVPAGQVVSQKTLAGIHVPKDTIVAFILSTGPPNQAPTITSSPLTTASSGQAYQYKVDATDPNPADTLTYSLTTQPSGMTINPASGLIEWTPSTAQVGQQAVAVKVQDAGGLSAMQSFTVVVAATENHPPTITSTPGNTGIVNGLYEYQMTASDLDAGDLLSYVLTSAPAGATLDASTGRLTWTPIASQLGPNPFSVRVNDNHGGSATQNYVVTVAAAPAPPVISSSAPLSATVGALYFYAVVASDPNPGDVLTYSLAVKPAGMIIDAATGAINWTPVEAQVGPQAVTVRVSDQGGLFVEQPFTVEVAQTPPDNRAPSIVSAPVTDAFIGTLYTYDVDASDADGDALVYSLDTAPSGMSIDAQSGVIRWTPTSSQLGLNNVVVHVADGRGGHVTQGYAVVVWPAINHAPEIVSSPVTSAISGTAYRYPVVASDADAGDSVSFSLDNAPAGMSIHPTSGLISWTPAANQLGPNLVTVRARDTHNEFATQRYTVTVTAGSGEVFTSIKVLPGDVTTITGEQQAFQAFGIRADGSSVNITTAVNWQSSAPALASITSAGVASALAAGQVTLRALQGAVTGMAAFTIQPAQGNGSVPTAAITAPLDQAVITEPVSVTGTAVDAEFLKYRLEIAPVGTSEFTLLKEGLSPVTNGALGTLDPTLLINDQYTLRLTVFDRGNNHTSTDLQVQASREQKVGNFTLAFQDVSVPTACLPVTVTRVYDSREKRVGDFGVGWRLDVQTVRLRESRTQGETWHVDLIDRPGPFGTVIPTYVLVEDAPHKISVTLPDGHVEEFDVRASQTENRFTPIQELSLQYVPRRGTLGTLAVEGGNPTLLLTGETGNVEFVDSDGGLFDPQRFRYTTPEGNAFVIRKNGAVEQVECSNGTKLTYSGSGISHDSGTGVAFTRDGQGRLSQVADPMGHAHRYGYDANGDLTQVTDPEGNVTRFIYDLKHNLLEIQDPRGVKAIRNEYDDSGRLTASSDPAGQVTAFMHDLVARSETVTDRLGHSTLYKYDAQGNVLEQVDALGNTTTMTYDEDGNEKTRTDALGHTTQRVYDTHRNVQEETDALGNITRYTYTALNAPRTVTDALGRVTTNTYDSKGNLLTTTDALGGVTQHTYDTGGVVIAGAGNLLSTTDALDHRSDYEYNAAGFMTRETDAQGKVTSYTYDANGNRLTEIRTGTVDGVEVTLVTRFAYDSLNRLVETTFPDGSTTRTVYNAIGKQAQTIDPLGRTTSYEYDELGRLTKTTYPDGTFETATFDAEGRRLTSRDRAGRPTTNTYDALGRLTTTTYADGTITSTTYDEIGQVKTTTDARGNVTRYTYDDAGRRATVEDALSQVTTFRYDPVGNQREVTDALGRAVTTNYDVGNRRTKTTYANGSFDTVAYDLLGRQTAKTDQARITTLYGYDELGRLTSVTDARNQVTGYTYDARGNQLTQTDAEGRTTRFDYDTMGRRIHRTLPLGQTETQTYDLAGNLATKTDFNGRTTRYTYDVLNHLTARIPDAVLNQPTIRYSYTASGQRKAMVDTSGTTSYVYDARDRLLQKTTPQGALSYTYDAAGNVLSIVSSNAGGASTSNTYDALNRVAKVTDAHGDTGYTYDAVGNLKTFTTPNGVTHAYTFDALNRLEVVEARSSAGPLARYTYTVGPTGNRTKVVELNGRTVEYGYDDLYRLTQEKITNDPADGTNGVIGYVYDKVGNRLTRTSTVNGIGAQTFTYDANDRLGSDTYDDNGNTIGSEGKTYQYDFENRLLGMNGDEVRMVYDGDGNRVRKTVGAETTAYLVDERNLTGYAQVLDEVVNGAVATRYTYGHDLLAQERSEEVSWYLYDGHGSVRGVTDLAGTRANSHLYDAFGISLNSPQFPSNYYAYGGEQFDGNLNLYYLRNRYLRSSLGRFESADAMDPMLKEPETLHKYNYANSNPANVVDPAGLFGIALSASLLDPLVGVALRNELLLAHKSTIIRGAILLGGVSLGVRPAIELRNQAIDLMIVGSSRGSQLLMDEGIRRYQLANRMLAASAQGIKIFDDKWKDVDKVLGYVKFASAIKTLTYTRSTIQVRTEIDRFSSFSQKVEFDWENHVVRVQQSLQNRTRFFQEVRVLTETSQELEIGIKSLSDFLFKRLIPDVVKYVTQ